jgi:hypothetical protein
MLDASDRDLVLNPTWKWNGNKDHEFVMNGQSDSNYATDNQTWMTKEHLSIHHGTIGRCTCDVQEFNTEVCHTISLWGAEQTAGILCAQDMIWCVRNVLESMGLKVKLPMIIKMDNKGDVDLANNWNILVVVTGMSMYYLIQCTVFPVRT